MIQDSTIKWFSDSFDTAEQAKADCNATGFFNRYGLFQAPDGRFVHANLRLQQWSKQEVAEIQESIQALTGYRMVEYTDSLFGWTPVKR